MEYKVVISTAQTPTGLQKISCQIEALMKDGWKLYGPPTFTTTPLHNNEPAGEIMHIAYQPMIRER